MMIKESLILLHNSRNFYRGLATNKFSVSTLIIGDHDTKHVDSGTLAAVTAAKKIGGTASIMFAKSTPSHVVEEAKKIDNVNKIFTLDSIPDGVYLGPEKVTQILNSVVKDYTHIIAASNNSSKSYIPRVAALFDSSPVTEVCEVINDTTFKRPMYAGNVLATVQMTDSIKFILIRGTSFDKAVIGTTNQASIESVKYSTIETNNTHNVVLVSESDSKKGDKPDLSTAKIVVSGGRGMKNSENFALLNALADKLGGAVGASRAAVDAGFISNDCQVGQTGKIVAPDLYIAVGISGAIQHLSGMKDSKTIVAINKDKEAPIFTVADYGLVGDLFKVIPELTSKL